MKKLLLSSAALCGLMMSAPAMAADGVKLELGGYIKGYAVWNDQDESAGNSARELDWLQNTEVHFDGETTLDNGLTVGFHTEGEADNNDAFEVEESYLFFSGAWGRVNLGSENGAAFLMQVDAPSADSNVDGVRQFIQPVNYNLTAFSGLDNSGAATLISKGGANDLEAVSTFGGLPDVFNFSYDDDNSDDANKLTYMTPVFSGLQLGLSYAPENDSNGNRSTNGVHPDNVADTYGDTYEVALRYSGEFEGVGVTLGGAFTHSDLEASSGTVVYIDADNSGTANAGDTTFSLDDRQTWNVGLNFDFGAFGLGAAYVADDLGFTSGADRDTWVVGGDYTNGPWKLGVSYYNRDQELFGADEMETDRYTGGVVYTYGPGMTFRGSISYIDNETTSLGDVEATSVLLGTQIKF